MILEMVLLPGAGQPREPQREAFMHAGFPGPLRAARRRCAALCLGGEVNAALLVGILFPPPAAGALAFPGFHGAGAGVAADAGVAPPVERMARDVVPADVLVYLLGVQSARGLIFTGAASRSTLGTPARESFWERRKPTAQALRS